MRKFGLAVALVAVLAVATGNVAAAEKSGTKKVALAVYNTAAAFIQDWVAAIREHPAVASGAVELTLFNGTGDQAVQDTQFSVILARKFDAIVLVANDMTFSTLMVHLAAREGIPVTASCAPIKSDDVLSYIGCDDEEAGYLNARAVLEKMGGKGNVAIIKGPPEQGAAIQRDAGIARALREFPEVKVLAVWPGNWSRNVAMQLTHQWLINYEGRLGGIIAQNDEMALGAIDAMKSLNHDILPVAGVDGIPEAVEAVKRGELLMTLYQDPVIEAQGALDVTLRHLLGPSYQPLSKAWRHYPALDWNDGQSKRYTVPWRVIRAE